MWEQRTVMADYMAAHTLTPEIPGTVKMKFIFTLYER
jgi:hypothetical protein